MAMNEREQVFQIVCVVRDLDETLGNWKKYVTFNEASIKLSSTEDAPIPCLYKGKEVPLRIRQARFDLGGIDMKLVQPLNESGDPYSDILKERGQGFHHIGICVEDPKKIDKVCAEWGIGPMCAQTAHGVTYKTYDLRESAGPVIEPWDHMIGPRGPEGAVKWTEEAVKESEGSTGTKLNLDVFMQVCMAVRDIDKALACWKELFDVDEESIHFSNSLEAFETGDLTPMSYYGVEGRYGYRQLNFDCCGINIEMFQPLDINEKGNPVSDFLREEGPGFHHISLRLNNRQEGLNFLKNDLGEKLGFKCMWEGLCFNRHYCYWDLRDVFGITLEVASRVAGPMSLKTPEELTAWGVRDTDVKKIQKWGGWE